MQSSSMKESQHRCLENCISQLPSELRDLILRRVEADRSSKLDYRRALAEELGISENSLRLRVYRIRVVLKKCINECLEKDRGNT
jgi:DNA-directed RNA polymerase specialized sigma24 family protein